MGGRGQGYKSALKSKGSVNLNSPVSAIISILFAGGTADEKLKELEKRSKDAETVKFGDTVKTDGNKFIKLSDGKIHYLGFYRKGDTIQKGDFLTDRRTKIHSDNLTSGERGTIEGYTLKDFRAYNKSLREGIKSEFNEEQALVTAISNLPSFKGTTYRTLRLDDTKTYNDVLKSYKKGSTITLKGVTSTSPSKKAVENFKLNPETKESGYFKHYIDYEIKGKNGKDISHLTVDTKTPEVVFNSGSKFKIVSVVKNKVKMQEV
jgi:hypothetical protein